MQKIERVKNLNDLNTIILSKEEIGESYKLFEQYQNEVRSGNNKHKDQLFYIIYICLKSKLRKKLNYLKVHNMIRLITDEYGQTRPIEFDDWQDLCIEGTYKIMKRIENKDYDPIICLTETTNFQVLALTEQQLTSTEKINGFINGLDNKHYKNIDRDTTR